MSLVLFNFFYIILRNTLWKQNFVKKKTLIKYLLVLKWNSRLLNLQFKFSDNWSQLNLKKDPPIIFKHAFVYWTSLSTSSNCVHRLTKKTPTMLWLWINSFWQKTWYNPNIDKVKHHRPRFHHPSSGNMLCICQGIYHKLSTHRNGRHAMDGCAPAVSLCEMGRISTQRRTEMRSTEIVSVSGAARVFLWLWYT